jgi:hypothetical protein
VIKEGVMELFKGDGVRLVINTDHHTHDGVRRIEAKEGNNYRREMVEVLPMERSRTLPKVDFGGTMIRIFDTLPSLPFLWKE